MNEDGVPETAEEIQDRIDDIESDIQSLAMDLDLAPAEILVRIALTMIRGCDSQEQTPEEEKQVIGEFLEALKQRAVTA